MAVTSQFFSGADLTAALLNQSSIAVVSATTDITLPFTGMVIFSTGDNTLYRYTGSAWVPFSGAGIALLTADSTPKNNNTTLASTLLSLPVLSGVNYVFESQLIYDTGTTPDIKFGFSMPAGAALRVSSWGMGAADSAIQTAIYHDAVDASSLIYGGAGVGTMVTGRPGGRLAMGGTSGDFVIQFAQNTANASNTIVKAGSWIRLTRA